MKSKTLLFYFKNMAQVYEKKEHDCFQTKFLIKSSRNLMYSKSSSLRRESTPGVVFNILS